MKTERFRQLVASIKDASKIHRGTRQPSRVFEYPPDEIKAIRAKPKRSQSCLAKLKFGPTYEAWPI